jgi:hypothetical protein
MAFEERRFLAWVFGVSLAAALLVGVVNAWVDPYLVFGRTRHSGFNDLKPAAASHDPLLKAYLATRAAPRTVVLGSSRAGLGIQPESPAWPAHMQPVHNLSVVGTGLGQQWPYLQLVTTRAQNPVLPQYLWVGLDFEAFLHPAKPASVAAAESPPAADDQLARVAALRAGGSPAHWQHVKDALAATLTLDALGTTVATVLASYQGEGNNLTAAGGTSEWQLADWTRTDGPYRMFEQKLELLARQVNRAPQYLSTEPGSKGSLTRDVDALLSWARQHQTQVQLVIQPSHATHLALLDALGYWGNYEQWKRAITAAVAQAQAAGTQVTLWDFGGFEPEFAEALSASSKTPLKGYWDPNHYSSALGDRMLATVYPVGHRTAVALSAQQLTPANLEARLSQVRADKLAWGQAHPKMARQVLEWARAGHPSDPTKHDVVSNGCARNAAPVQPACVPPRVGDGLANRP